MSQRTISLTVTAVLAVLGAGLSAQAKTPAHGKRLGGLDLAGYCQAHGSQVVQPGPIQGPGAAFKWRCGSAPIDMNKACAFQYPGKRSVAVVGNPNDAFSWNCFLKRSSGKRHGHGKHHKRHKHKHHK